MYIYTNGTVDNIEFYNLKRKLFDLRVERGTKGVASFD
jgi:hypothetical protein